MSKYKVGIIGATGYTGSELVRLLFHHPETEISFITSESRKGEKFSAIHPQFTGLMEMELVSMDDIDLESVDIVFLALPHGVSMDFIKTKWNKKTRIIDLSGDFRLKSAETYEKWYPKKHVAPELIEKAVYGLPEINRDKIRNATLIANPGCYPTSAILPLYPLIKNNLIDPESIIVDSKSGVTGAGAKAKPGTHFPSVFGNFSAYGIKSHRHSPEIIEALSASCGKNVNLLFTPHLLPIDRGILTTTYSTPSGKVSEESLKEEYYKMFSKEFFIRLMDNPPGVKQVRGSNFCDIFVTYDERTNKIITVSAIDNLVKGAAGQAIQNMNVMFGLLEKSGLEIPPLSP